MKCPKCKAPLGKAHMADVEIERCDGCKGLWFDKGEEEKLAHIGVADMLDLGHSSIGAEFNKDEPIFCPKDHTQLVRIRDPKQTHIELDRCPHCEGTFFDAGEFTDYKNNTPMDLFRGLLSRFKS